jgi:DUF4097 and DUF4098 domain-containing protein YvlB
MLSMRRATIVSLLALIFVAHQTLGETRKELRFTVGPNAIISVLNQYGPITVKPSANNQMTVTAIPHSDRVEVDQDQSGSRVEIRSHLLAGADAQSGQVDYEVLVPAGASLYLYSPTGPLRVEKFAGDVSLEGASAVVDVRDVSHAHVHVKTMNGPVTLVNIQEGRVDITSVSGEVRLTQVSGPFVHVSCTSGKIFYDGDFGAGGQYSLISHSGDIEAIIPPGASFDVTARSIKGKVENDFPFQPKSHTAFPLVQGSSFAGTIGQASSSVVLKSFSGKIRLKKR